MNKRDRCLNFSKECEMLVNIVHRYKHVIENKTSKMAAWKIVADKFNYYASIRYSNKPQIKFEDIMFYSSFLTGSCELLLF